MSEEDQHKEVLVSALQTLGLDNGVFEEDNFILEKKLSVYLNDLIVKDFNKLISTLYRIDISQDKAVAALVENAKVETAGETIARLIINRQKEKLHFRTFFKNRISNDD